jgi:hypothetical protein
MLDRDQLDNVILRYHVIHMLSTRTLQRNFFKGNPQPSEYITQEIDAAWL